MILRDPIYTDKHLVHIFNYIKMKPSIENGWINFEFSQNDGAPISNVFDYYGF